MNWTRCFIFPLKPLHMLDWPLVLVKWHFDLESRRFKDNLSFIVPLWLDKKKLIVFKVGTISFQSSELSLDDSSDQLSTYVCQLCISES